MWKTYFQHIVEVLKGKGTRVKPQHIPSTVKTVLQYILREHKDVTLTSDFMVVNGNFFLHTKSRKIHFHTVAPLQCRTMAKHWSMWKRPSLSITRVASMTQLLTINLRASKMKWFQFSSTSWRAGGTAATLRVLLSPWRSIYGVCGMAYLTAVFHWLWLLLVSSSALMLISVDNPR